MVKDSTLSRKDDEDVNQHVDDVMEIADYFNIANASQRQEQTMLRVFLITLIRVIKRCLKVEPSPGIETCDALKIKFLKRFSQPAKIAKLKMKIQIFQQLRDCL
ncbi:hypothetical protein LXL04_008759 [Taraxacum kok-saghyz]